MKKTHIYFYLSLLSTGFAQINGTNAQSTTKDFSQIPYEELLSLEKDFFQASNELNIDTIRKLWINLTTETNFNSLKSYNSRFASNILFSLDDAFLKAAKKGNADFMLEILQISNIKIDVNHRDGDGRTAFMHTAARGDVGLIQKLVKIPGINVNQIVYENSYTALMEAVDRGDINMVRELVRIPGIDLNHRSYPFNYSALTLTCKPFLKNKEVIREVLLNIPGIEITDADKSLMENMLSRY